MCRVYLTVVFKVAKFIIRVVASLIQLYRMIKIKKIKIKFYIFFAVKIGRGKKEGKQRK